MRWAVAGANAIIAVRCCVLSGGYEGCPLPMSRSTSRSTVRAYSSTTFGRKPMSTRPGISPPPSSPEPLLALRRLPCRRRYRYSVPPLARSSRIHA